MTVSANAVSNDAARAQQATDAADRNALGKNDFLRLLTAQLSNQDPLKPVDNQAFIAQLAQFSSLEQLHGLSTQLDSLLLAAASSNQMGTASLVGKDASFKASGVDLVDGTASALQANLGARASVVAVVQGEGGRTVRTLALGVHEAGSFEIGWDGRDDRGEPVPPGHYAVKLLATGADGAEVPVETRARGRVQGVSFDSGAAELLIGGSRVKLSDVLEITQA